MPSPQQDNSSDCGIYVLLATTVLIQRLLGQLPREAGSNPWSLEDVFFNAEKGRQQFQRMIAEMIEQRGRVIGTKDDIEISPASSPARTSQQSQRDVAR
jgi:Ulp1 family protease